MKLFLLYYSIMVVGYVVASKCRNRFNPSGKVNSALTFIMYVIVFIMGIRMGSNEEVTANLGTIGVQSVVISMLTVTLSMLAITIMRKAMRLNKYGEKIVNASSASETENVLEKSSAALNESDAKNGENDNKDNLKTTLFITIDVIISMAVGYFAIRPMFAARYEVFDNFTSNAIVVGLCFLTCLVGLSLGFDGTVFERLKEAGVKVLIVPLLMITGTVTAGVLFALCSSFSLKEAVAISLGFGWYTYAPSIITEAGYVMAGAVSFLHNVIRETAGIILIPFIAQKIGYIECTTVPGIASMDICMPIIERSCRPDTIVYGLSNGLCASLACSLLVPIVISL